MSNEDAQHHVRYSVTISENLSERIDQRVMILKRLGNKKTSKQKWIVEAIREKIDSDDKQKNIIPKEKHLCISLEKQLFTNLSLRVSRISKFRSCFSKKKYILEAIAEKLEREEEEAENLILSLDKDFEH